MHRSKSLTLILIVFCLLASACTPGQNIFPFAGTATPAISQTPTLTPAPTQSPTAILPTPTFNARAITTVTPAPAAKCPAATPVAKPDINFLDFDKKPENNQNLEKNTLKFLNDFGVVAFQTALQKSPKGNKIRITFQDLNGDGVKEILIPGITLYIFGCTDGKYQTLFQWKSTGLFPAAVEQIKDINHNGLPELTLLLGAFSQGGRMYGVYEWNGQKFADLLPLQNPNDPDSGTVRTEATGKIRYAEVDSDGLQELILDSGLPDRKYSDGLPIRNKTTYYQWNGANYIPTISKYSAPEFRFQAVQDGDLATLQEEYPRALDFYQQVILTNSLKAYSPEMAKYLKTILLATRTAGTPVPTIPAADKSEAVKLAAYAYYRMVILHVHINQMDAAKTKYTTLQTKFPAESPGLPYAEMASAFWDEYQTSQSMANACNAAIHYAGEHPEMLTVLGSDYHGAQSHTYIATDVCPFH